MLLLATNETALFLMVLFTLCAVCCPDQYRGCTISIVFGLMDQQLASEARFDCAQEQLVGSQTDIGFFTP